MRKIITYLICILLLSSILVFADADNSNLVDLKPKLDTNEGKYGYVDGSGNWVITPRFQEADEFSEGLALVRCFDENDRQMAYTGYINSKGELAFEKKFFWGYPFKNGYAAVTDKEDKLSIIDRNGNVVLNTDYYYYSGSSEMPGIHTVISNVYPGRSITSPIVGYITNDLKLVKPMFNRSPSYYRLDECEETFPMTGYAEYDASGNMIKSANYLINRKLEPVLMPEGFVSSIKDGMVLINGGSTFAFIDLDGNIYDEIYSSITGQKHKFVKAEPFNDGHALVEVEGVLEDIYGDPIKAYGYINLDGTVFMEPKCSSANSFREGLAAVQLHPSYLYGTAVMKANGEYLLPPKVRPKVAYAENEESYFTEYLYSQAEYDFVKDEVARIVSEITTKNMSDLEKLDVIHKYVVEHTVYSFFQVKERTPLGMDYKYEAIGILKGKSVVCDGYAKLLGLMLNEAGVENMKVVGEAGTDVNSYAPHGWNLVKIDGKFYHVDATWNDYDGPNKYYLVSDEYMKKSRVWEYSNYPEAPKGYFNDKFQPKK